MSFWLMRRMSRAQLVVATVWALLCCGICPAADLAEAAADGSLWKKSHNELASSILNGARFREVDDKTDRFQGSKKLTIAGVQTLDVTVQWDDDKRSHIVGVHTTFYNKGDNEPLDKAEFEKSIKTCIGNISSVMGVEPKSRRIDSKDAGVKPRAWVWENENSAVLLEALSTGAGKRYVAEFIRVTIKPTVADLERGGADDAAKRADLKAHVRTDKEGSVWLEGIPMVDQGEKGYCVPATLSRVFAYYNMDGVDQHALAAICKSSGDEGTSIESMSKALKSISSKFHMGVTSWRWIDQKSLSKDLNKMVQKRHISPEMVTPSMLLDLIKSKPSLMKKGLKDIRKYIDSGIPVVWAVMLGIFPENGLPQSAGGHMRLIIGYNEEKQMIIYTDSWGAGHDLKAMPLAQACAISHMLFVLRPLR